MALRASVYKVDLTISDLDRQYYGDHALTLARHPSETEERLMLRLLAFIKHADERLEFGKGLSSEDEPDLWRKDLTGTIEQWIMLGLPDERWVRKACGRSQQVVVLSYGGNRAQQWWATQREALQRYRNLTVLGIDPQASQALAALAARQMKLTATLQEGQFWIDAAAGSASFELTVLKQDDPA